MHYKIKTYNQIQLLMLYNVLRGGCWILVFDLGKQIYYHKSNKIDVKYIKVLLYYEKLVIFLSFQQISALILCLH